jgi:hypothetical protein
MSIAWKIILGLLFIAGTAIFVDKACDNASLPLWMQAVFALPCFPLFWFWGYIAGIGFFWSAMTEGNT